LLIFACSRGVSAWFWGVFRGTFGLNVGGVKHAVLTKFAFRKRLRIVFERIWQRF
jgi:hypothetical protein